MDETKSISKPRQPNYVGVFVILAVLTALEVGVTYLPFMEIPTVRFSVLVPIALLKAVLVALYYMHLKFDRKIFTVLFSFGLLMAFGLIISFLIIFGARLTDFKL